MRKSILALVVMVSLGAFAQKGSFYVGGQAGYTTTETKVGSTVTSEGSTWSFSPEVGTFLTNNIQLGVAFNVRGTEDTDDVNNVKDESTYFGGTVYSRYFFGEGTKAFRPFVGVNAEFLPGNLKRTASFGNSSTVSEADLFRIGANLNAGFAYSLSSRVAVVGSLGVLGFSSEKESPKNGGVDTKTNSFGFDLNSLGNRFNIGLYVTL